MSGTLSTAKNHSKKTKDAGRERDRFKTTSESGSSSQCDTPPLTEKDAGPSQGRYAGIGPESVQCMADQVGVEMTSEAVVNLAEDASYKLRQIISTIALHSELMKKTRVDSWDVNTAFNLADTGPIVGASASQYTQFGEEKLFCPLDKLVNVNEFALTSQKYYFSSHPTVAVEWVTDEKSLNANTNISANLHNYYTKVARAILNLRKKPKEVAVEDLMTNTRIGPIFPNLFNLAVLVLNDDNLNALNVPNKKPLQSNVLDMVDALCSNPCSLDTNIQQQRLFPVMVSNILGNGPLAEKMVAILTKITRTWPSFIAIGKSILFDYLSQGTKERLTAPMIKCVMALGRQALVDCLGDHLSHIDDALHAPTRGHRTDVRTTILEVSTVLLRSEPTTYLEDYVITDYTLYEMLGDSILPRRTIFPVKVKSKSRDTTEKVCDEDIFAPRPLRRAKLRVIPVRPSLRNGHHRELVFEPKKLRDRCIKIKVRNCRTLQVPNRITPRPQFPQNNRSGVIIASGFLNRFKFKVNKCRESIPLYGAFTL